mmetsp:Transcript_11072/g.16830  ORF Transcript_11072/g.16830 Transcript_11072/m.16830 type:complete len:95 (-) Transcript_11072:3-287(-)
MLLETERDPAARTLRTAKAAGGEVKDRIRSNPSNDYENPEEEASLAISANNENLPTFSASPTDASFTTTLDESNPLSKYILEQQVLARMELIFK